MEHAKVSVIIPSHNRYALLMEAIESVRAQTHKNFEIIVVNDASTEKAYYTNRPVGGIKWIDLAIGGKEKFGHPAPGYVRNFGLKEATGEFIAFLDDDDLWLPHKTMVQLARMSETGCEMSSSDGYIGNSFDKSKNYYIYNREYYRVHAENVLGYGDLPEFLSLELLRKWNCIINSSVIMRKSLADGVGVQKNLSFAEDYDFWLRSLEYTDCAHISEPLIFCRKRRMIPDKSLNSRIRTALHYLKSRIRAAPHYLKRRARAVIKNMFYRTGA